jgi:hypothetical protein
LAPHSIRGFSLANQLINNHAIIVKSKTDRTNHRSLWIYLARKLMGHFPADPAKSPPNPVPSFMKEQKYSIYSGLN